MKKMVNRQKNPYPFIFFSFLIIGIFLYIYLRFYSLAIAGNRSVSGCQSVSDRRNFFFRILTKMIRCILLRSQVTRNFFKKIFQQKMTWCFRLRSSALMLIVVEILSESKMDSNRIYIFWILTKMVGRIWLR